MSTFIRVLFGAALGIAGAGLFILVIEKAVEAWLQ